MKITKDTKIGDLIPDGYDLNIKDGFSFIDDETGNISIHLKKKEEKNFEWYVYRYEEKIYDLFESHKIRGYKDLILQINDTEKLIYNRWQDIPFEVKIGLLKFICDDKKLNFSKEISYRNTKGCWYHELISICPKEFLDSIFE